MSEVAEKPVLTSEPMNAYARARVVRPGCTHQLGCRCEPPYWLRLSTEDEAHFEQWMRGQGLR